MNLTHPMGAVDFNPAAKPGDPDYGLLYTSGSDFGFSNGGGPNASNPAQTQRLDSIIGAILRIDPRSPSVTGGRKGLGDYTVPAANKLAAHPHALGEIYAFGFRNAHRLSWDTDGTMFASDIGMNHIEEVNIVRNGLFHKQLWLLARYQDRFHENKWYRCFFIILFIHRAGVIMLPRH